MAQISRILNNIWTWREVKHRLFQILIALDVFLFSLLTFGGAKRNQTMSAAAYDLEQRGKWQGKLFRPLIDWLLQRLEKDHCYKAWLVENRIDLWNPPTQGQA